MHFIHLDVATYVDAVSVREQCGEGGAPGVSGPAECRATVYQARTCAVALQRDHIHLSPAAQQLQHLDTSNSVVCLLEHDCTDCAEFGVASRSPFVAAYLWISQACGSC